MGILLDNDVIVTGIILTIVLVTSVGILVLRDIWRSHVGMPQAERKRQVQNLVKWEMVFFQVVIGTVFLVKVVHAIIGLALLVSAYFTWRNGWPPWQSGKPDRP